MVEPISELRKICQSGIEDSIYASSWFKWHISRAVSIYFTWLFLKMGISANQVTVMRFFVGIAAGILFVWAEPKYWLIAAAIFYLSQLLDYSDGEVARYNKSTSLFGGHLDGLADFLIWPYISACMSFGLYNALHHISVFIFGFLSVASFLLLRLASGLLQSTAGVNLSSEASRPSIARNSKLKTMFSVGLEFGKVLFGTYTLPIPLMAVAIVDCFIGHYTIAVFPLLGSVTINTRYLYFAALAIVQSVVAFYTMYQDLYRLKQPKA